MNVASYSTNVFGVEEDWKIEKVMNMVASYTVIHDKCPFVLLQLSAILVVTEAAE